MKKMYSPPRCSSTTSSSLYRVAIASASGTWKFFTSCEYWMYVASNASVSRSKNR